MFQKNKKQTKKTTLKKNPKGILFQESIEWEGLYEQKFPQSGWSSESRQLLKDSDSWAFILEILIWEVWSSTLRICISKTFNNSRIYDSPLMTT